MKKIVSFLLCIVMIFTLVSCSGEVGPQGEQGIPGADGEDGKDGITPTIEISDDGYWVINGVKTEHRAVGENGQDGENGGDGAPDYDCRRRGASGGVRRLRVRGAEADGEGRRSVDDVCPVRRREALRADLVTQGRHAADSGRTDFWLIQGGRPWTTKNGTG